MKKEIVDKIIEFRNSRDWKKFHNGKDLAISLTLEAAELLEAFQWSGADTTRLEKKPEIMDELADMFIYATLIADAYDIDIEKAISDKLELNAKRYPIDKAKGNNTKYDKLK